MEDKIQKFTKRFSAYVPNIQVAHQFAHWVIKHSIKVDITQARKSKRGDYRPPYGQHNHRISINGDLNPYAFSITFIHEIAHLYTWEQFKNSVQPHGSEWKFYFKQLMKPFLATDVFPSSIHQALSLYMKNPSATTCRDNRLMKVLSEYDKPLPQGWKVLGELSEGALFQVEDRRVFKKESQLRKNFRCLEISTGKYYRISPQMKVKEYLQ